ncbi:hypothetical protein AXA44_07785 [Rhodococcus sp. SC4]|nr:hypothetical protein AXA44_07785 [Rhodococcus sp. SC4]
MTERRSSSDTRRCALSGQVAMVTGGSQGIGRVISEALAEAGATVVAASRRAEDFLSPAGQRIHGRRLDVENADACHTVVASVQEEFGSLDVLVNNAGIAESVKFLEMDMEHWRRHHCIDVEAPLRLVRAALPMMLERNQGRVISIASIAAEVGFSYVTAYVAAKHALLGMTRSLAAEFAGTSLTFNCVSPYYTNTPMAAAAIRKIVAKTGKSVDQASAHLLSPQGRMIEPDEVAAMCVYLASPSARSITGQSIAIDGGLSATR